MDVDADTFADNGVKIHSLSISILVLPRDICQE
jgi:hypothetical protein